MNPLLERISIDARLEAESLPVTSLSLVGASV